MAIKNKKHLLFFLFLFLIFFVSVFSIAFIYPKTIFKVQQENDFELDIILKSCLEIQSAIKESDSFLLLYLAFSIPDHKALFDASLKRLNENILVLEEVVKGEDSISEFEKLKSNLRSFESASSELLKLHEENPAGFFTENYDHLAKVTIDAAFMMIDHASEIGKVNIINHGLRISVPANKVELTLASYYWGFDSYKEKYFKQMSDLNKTINEYSDLPFESKLKIEEIHKQMVTDYDLAYDAGNKIIEELELNRTKDIKDLDNIFPFIQNTAFIKNAAIDLINENFPGNFYYLPLVYKKIKLFNLILFILGGLFLIYFCFLIYFVFKILK